MTADAVPELTGSSLNYLELPQSCSDGYSTSRTCEMSLSNHSDVNFRGLVEVREHARRDARLLLKK